MRYAGRAVFGAACLLAALSLAAVAHLDRRGGAAVDDAAGSAPGSPRRPWLPGRCCAGRPRRAVAGIACGSFAKLALELPTRALQVVEILEALEEATLAGPESDRRVFHRTN